ncbi:hypothetical protein XELAEV_18040002mg [Xenopus laevis]|uniref:Uncharacterized protein n=1 Tax=Xenopus laevis TaxID=8355 RepID=A0A974C8U1_XENLA|nr:hypothetical protein XELAEV_18040002mg [Xenopus laevis]
MTIIMKLTLLEEKAEGVKGDGGTDLREVEHFAVTCEAVRHSSPTAGNYCSIPAFNCGYPNCCITYNYQLGIGPLIMTLQCL